MIANYHTHTPRCRHASGEEEAYVRNAIARGLTTFGFSDHTPQYFPGEYYSFMRMYPQELEDYCGTVRALRKQYQGQLDIPLGLESEYYPGTWQEQLPRLQDAGIEYLILGQHWLGNEENEHGCSAPTADEHLLKRYCRQVMEGLETEKFSYLAHPDLFRFVGEPRIYRRHMGEVIELAREGGIPLEINLLGIHSRRHYPCRTFWELAAEIGGQVILGMDAHDPRHVLDTAPEETALELVNSLGLNLISTMELKPI